MNETVAQPANANQPPTFREQGEQLQRLGEQLQALTKEAFEANPAAPFLRWEGR